MKHIHPFPARMAPELALAALREAPGPGRVLDPMSGSGTVLRHAAFAGHEAFAFDLDPLAVLISSVSSRKFDLDFLEELAQDVIEEVEELRREDVALPWIDKDPETRAFVEYWFAPKQRSVLRKIAYVLYGMGVGVGKSRQKGLDALKLALSRIIITKERGASLAEDVSHSRPHRTRDDNDFDVLYGFERSVQQLIGFLENGMPDREGVASIGDARRLRRIGSNSIDLVITSPPYLNAIDYLRGHKLSLVWLGFTIPWLRAVRAKSIGSDRAADRATTRPAVERITGAMKRGAAVPSRIDALIMRYAADVHRMMGEISRVLTGDGKAVLVVGDSCLKSHFISNSAGVIEAARMHGLTLNSHAIRELPASSRYLPTTGDSLSKRMKYESVLTFARA